MTDFKLRTMPHRIRCCSVRTIVGIADKLEPRSGAGAVATVGLESLVVAWGHNANNPLAWAAEPEQRESPLDMINRFTVWHWGRFRRLSF